MIGLHNYEITKLAFANADLTNALILLSFVLLSVITVRKAKADFLSRFQTEQLKGLAILFVICGHLWVHTAENKPFLVFSGDAVAIFLVLSGYGLMQSFQMHPSGAKNFFFRRIRRVFIPYWLSTILILILDCIILNRTYSQGNLLSTFLGININQITQHVDYVRWYITFLLLWYASFAIFIVHTKNNKGVFILLFVAAIVFPLDYYALHFGWYQIFAFPIGCFLSLHKPLCNNFITRYKTYLLYFSICLLILIAIYKIYFKIMLSAIIPYIILTFMNEIFSALFVLSLILVVAYFGKHDRYSHFLFFMGSISYEVFLLHGVALIKYNPFITSKAPFIAVSQFFIFLSFITLISLIFKKLLIQRFQ